jgi:putative transposase
METVSIQRLDQLSRRMKAALREAQLEAARCWNDVTAHHRQARAEQGTWPQRDQLQKLTKGKYKLHSQTVQMIGHQLLANVEATAERCRNDPSCRRWLKYPYKDKRYFPLYWPAQAVSYDPAAKRLVLPMGRGRKSLVFKLALDFVPGGAKLVWRDGYVLH